MDGWIWSAPFGMAAKSDEPAVHVTFDDANAYCSWAGKRLPKDKEWAKAAFTEFRSNPTPPFVTGVTRIARLESDRVFGAEDEPSHIAPENELSGDQVDD